MEDRERIIELQKKRDMLIKENEKIAKDYLEYKLKDYELKEEQFIELLRDYNKLDEYTNIKEKYINNPTETPFYNIQVLLEYVIKKKNNKEVEFNINDFKSELNKLVNKYGAKYGRCTSKEQEKQNGEEGLEIIKEMGSSPAWTSYSRKFALVIFDNKYNWTKLENAKEEYLRQMSKYKKRKEMGLDIRCLDINDVINNCVEIMSTHEYFHVLDYANKFKISTDERILKIHREQKERILDELGHYAYYGQDNKKEIHVDAKRELCAEAFKYIIFAKEDRPELANEIIKIIEEICLNKVRKHVGIRN